MVFMLSTRILIITKNMWISNKIRILSTTNILLKHVDNIGIKKFIHIVRKDWKM